MGRNYMLSNQIKFYRKCFNYTQSQLAEKLHISRQALAHYENGDREPSVDTIKKLCIIFDITADELLEINQNK